MGGLGVAGGDDGIAEVGGAFAAVREVRGGNGVGGACRKGFFADDVDFGVSVGVELGLLLAHAEYCYDRRHLPG